MTNTNPAPTGEAVATDDSTEVIPAKLDRIEVLARGMFDDLLKTRALLSASERDLAEARSQLAAANERVEELKAHTSAVVEPLREMVKRLQKHVHAFLWTEVHREPNCCTACGGKISEGDFVEEYNHTPDCPIHLLSHDEQDARTLIASQGVGK